jgi:hypothetical protein
MPDAYTELKALEALLRQIADSKDAKAKSLPKGVSRARLEGEAIGWRLAASFAATAAAVNAPPDDTENS